MANRKFIIETNDFLQGHFDIRKKNIAFIFQVNCPGCFAHGIPLFNELFNNFNSNIGFIGISTAFEDFELNTESNTKMLLTNGQTVGETAKYLKTAFGSDIYGEKLNFPVAFDTLIESLTFLNEENILTICNMFEPFKMANTLEQLRFKEELKFHYSKSKKVPATFTLNQLQGTPSFIIFDDNYTILQSFFGHQSYKTLADKLKK